MAIQDSDPERRNLVVTSLCFILFYLGGGEFPNDEIRLQVVNVTFKCPEVLGVAAWLMLFWFALRYWQTHYNNVINAIDSDATSLITAEELIAYVLTNTKLQRLRDVQARDAERWEMSTAPVEAVQNAQITTQNNRWAVEISVAKRTNHNKENPGRWREKGAQRLILQGWDGTWIKLKAVVGALVKKPSFAGLLVPYFMFYAAVLIPIIKRLA